MTRFRKVLSLLNELKHRRIIKDYTIGGGVAAYRYIERPTKDLDIFILLESQRALIDLSPIWNYLKGKGYSKWVGQYLLIEEYPIEFIPAKGLDEEAIKRALVISYEGIRTKVMRPEYLIAIFLKVGRLKDKNRVRLMLAEVKLDKKLLMDILSRYKLTRKLYEIER